MLRKYASEGKYTRKFDICQIEKHELIENPPFLEKKRTFILQAKNV